MSAISLMKTLVPNFTEIRSLILYIRHGEEDGRTRTTSHYASISWILYVDLTVITHLLRFTLSKSVVQHQYTLLVKATIYDRDGTFLSACAKWRTDAALHNTFSLSSRSVVSTKYKAESLLATQNILIGGWAEVYCIAEICCFRDRYGCPW